MHYETPVLKKKRRRSGEERERRMERGEEERERREEKKQTSVKSEASPLQRSENQSHCQAENTENTGQSEGGGVHWRARTRVGYLPTIAKPWVLSLPSTASGNRDRQTKHFAVLMS